MARASMASDAPDNALARGTPMGILNARRIGIGNTLFPIPNRPSRRAFTMPHARTLANGRSSPGRVRWAARHAPGTAPQQLRRRVAPTHARSDYYRGRMGAAKASRAAQESSGTTMSFLSVHRYPSRTKLPAFPTAAQ
jgi:hypothetical protein